MAAIACSLSVSKSGWLNAYIGGMQSSATALAIKLPRIVGASGVSNMRSGKLPKSKSKPVRIKKKNSNYTLTQNRSIAARQTHTLNDVLGCDNSSVQIAYENRNHFPLRILMVHGNFNGHTCDHLP